MLEKCTYFYLLQENETLKQQIEVFESEKSDFDHQKKEFYEKRDNKEELHDLQKQELAKLKHMVRVNVFDLWQEYLFTIVLNDYA